MLASKSKPSDLLGFVTQKSVADTTADYFLNNGFIKSFSAMTPCFSTAKNLYC